jgi:putative acetyltransferase
MMPDAIESTCDPELLAAFENCTLPCDQWTHRAHVRIGYLYASQLALEEATARMRSGLRAINAVHGTPDSLERGYHETITIAFLRLILAAIEQHGPFQSSQAFCESRPELLDKNALLQYYSRDRIKSHTAKARFVEPDLAHLPMTIVIRPETLADHAAVAEVNRLAFGQDEEADLVTALRDSGHVSISLVAEVEGRIVGHILFGPLTIATNRGAVAALSLAPMAVTPARQRQGIGCRLIEEGLRRCREAGHKIVIVVGHPDYYPRFGFSTNLAATLLSPFAGSPAWMALELVPGALHGVKGTVKYPAPFGIADGPPLESHPHE